MVKNKYFRISSNPLINKYIKHFKCKPSLITLVICLTEENNTFASPPHLSPEYESLLFQQKKQEN